jgi:hypothetical protein
MEFEKIREGWIPLEDPQFRVEEWDCQDRTEDAPSEDAYYLVSDMKGTEVMNTADWGAVVSYLRAVVGEDCVPDDSAEGHGFAWV